MKRPELPSRRIVNDLGKSEIVVTPTGLVIVEELASRGCSVVTISAALGVNKETFVHMRRRDPAVEEAFERGRAKEHDRLVSNLNTAAASGNVVASIFLLRARHNYQSGEGIDMHAAVEREKRNQEEGHGRCSLTPLKVRRWTGEGPSRRIASM